ncbi:hypothetical protein [Erwinia sp. CGal63]|uniref:hypothetical protein n=1 Tax=Erwinia sp. CGal63 TaxID=2919889 RepID=UPI00300A0816
MKIAVSSIKPFTPSRNFCYLVRVDKAQGWWIEYIVDISPLSPHLYCLFTERYDLRFVRQNFFMVSFYSLDALLGGKHLYEPEPRMRYSKDELQEMLLKGIGEAIAIFIQEHAPCVLIALPARPGLARIYDRLLNAQAMYSGYRYITHYKEDGIYVIEKR